MAQKTLGVRVGTYDRLARLKLPGETFSDLIERMADGLHPAPDLRDLFGALSADDAERLRSELRRSRAEGWSR